MLADGQDAIFDRLLTTALQTPEIDVALRKRGAPTAAELRQRALDQRAVLLGGVAGLESEFRRAAAASEAGARRHRWTGRVRLVVLVVAVLLTLAVSALVGIGAALEEALKHQRPVEVAQAIFGPFVFLGMVGGTVWLTRQIAAHGRVVALFNDGSGAAQAKASANRAAVVAAVILVGVCVAGALPRALWELANHRIATDNSVPGRWYLIGLAVALVYGMLLIRPSDKAALRSAESAANQAALAWTTALLQDAILPLLRAEINAAIERRFSTTLPVIDAAGLRVLTDESFHVHTPAADQLRIAASNMGSGGVALCGPRGAGKTYLLTTFAAGRYRTADDPPDHAVVVPAPANFDRREFMLYLYAEVCRHVESAGPAELRQQARDELTRIRHLSTSTTTVRASLGWRGLSAGRDRAAALARQPLTYPEILADLRAFLSVVAAAVARTTPGGAGGRRPRFIIGVDELDRIQPADRARDFLNELKAVFGVRDCLFLVSISDETLVDANLAELGRRDLFDSAIDEVVRVGHLSYETAGQILDRRVIDLPEPFAAVFYCVSGGLARELLRTARTAISIAGAVPAASLSAVTEHLIRRELIRLRSSAIGALRTGPSAVPLGLARILADDTVAAPAAMLRGLVEHIGGHSEAWDDPVARTLVVRAFHLDTIAAVFRDGLTEANVTSARDPAAPGSFDALAGVHRNASVFVSAAWATLDAVRRAWDQPPLPEWRGSDPAST
ncbi:hypothetical protein ABT297_40880 [Dactylosporangium sp. NPDC000555]|uniref:hypothetical protein n=1 Tax=Dactylosporangium sp. NPDC000555 TaxID=3154260 RepID=UPI00333455A4